MALSQKILLDSDRCNASGCDRCVVNLLYFQWMQNHKSICSDSQRQSIVAPLKQSIDQVAMITVAIDGQVRFISQRAEYLLRQYSLPHSSQALPDLLHQWFQDQIAQLPTNGNDPSLSSPLVLEQAGRQLIIRFVSGYTQEYYFLLVEERLLPSLTISALEFIGLTKREAEILSWIAKDKSNAEIAKLLDCREGTVRKHLENLHRKLGVQTRTAAVMVALERLGLIRV